jgi:hypothetical protein
MKLSGRISLPSSQKHLWAQPAAALVRWPSKTECAPLAVAYAILTKALEVLYPSFTFSVKFY